MIRFSDVPWKPKAKGRSGEVSLKAPKARSLQEGKREADFLQGRVLGALLPVKAADRKIRSCFDFTRMRDPAFFRTEF
jgi:hypothetical protein